MKSLFLSLLFLSLLLVACKDTPIIPPGYSLAAGYKELKGEDYGETSHPHDWQYVSDDTTYIWKMSFQDGAPATLIYFARTESKNAIMWYDMETQQGGMVTDMPFVSSNICANKNGWLAFSSRQHGLAVIKLNGDSLQVVAPAYGEPSAWHPNGDTLYFGSPVDFGSNCVKAFKKDGVWQTETLPDRYYRCDCFNFDGETDEWFKFLYSPYSETELAKIYQVRAPGDTIAEFASPLVGVFSSNIIGGNKEMNEIVILNQNKGNTSNYSYIFKYRLTDGTMECVRKFHYNNLYMWMAASPNGQHIISSRHVVTKLDYRTKKGASWVVRMNYDGTDETVLNLPLPE
jgi:hypothetical protein